MSVHDMLASVRKHWLLIVALTVLATVGMGVLSWLTTPQYKASASLLVTVNSSGTDLSTGSNYTRDQMLSIGQLARMPVVLQGVISDLDLSQTPAQLDDSVAVTIPTGTTILSIAVTDPSAGHASEVANSVANNLAKVVEQISPKNTDGEPTMRARVVKEAVPPSYPASPNTSQNLLAGFVIGLIGGIAVAYVRDLLDTRVRRTEDVEELLNTPVLAKVSRWRGEPDEFVGSTWNTSARAEEFRRLRTNLEYLDVGQEEVCVVFSSALPGEGKTTTCASLAEVLAESGKRVLAIDADLRRPRLAAHFGLTSDVGLTTVLIGRASLEDVVQPVSEKLDVLASGSVPPNPSELLDSPPMRSVLSIAKDRYDIVLVDAPPLLPVADAVILSRISSGVILVADTRRVRANQLAEAAQSVTAAGGQIRGVVLNRVRESRSSAYQYETKAAPGVTRIRRSKPPVRAGEARPVQDTTTRALPTAGITPEWQKVDTTSDRPSRRG